ncbi:MAG: radical SAM protein, partial [Planctomycetota bacterium]
MTFEVDNTNFTSLRDRFGRIHTSVRVSVTDRCNIRCFYCMPEKVQFMPRKEVLSYEEIVRVISILARLGINQVRITGGEPLVRSNIWKLIQQIRSIGMIEDIGLTT